MKVNFSNFLARIFFASVSEEQFMVPVPPPKILENFTIWYEKNFLNVDISNIAIKQPIFLIGLHRSGTTMLQDILCNHPDLAYINNSMHVFRRSFCASEEIRKKLNINFRMERYLQDSVEVKADSPNEGYIFWQEWLKEDSNRLNYVERTINYFSTDELEYIKQSIRKIIWCFGGQNKRFFCKNPALLPYLPLLQDIFPDAKFIHIIRDARTCSNSMSKFYRLTQKQLNKIKYKLCNFVHDDKNFIPYPRLPKLSEYIQQYGPDDIRTTANIWNDGINFVNHNKSKISNFYEIRYEDILANPQSEIFKIIDFCELNTINSNRESFLHKLNQVGKVNHKQSNKYGNFDTIELICRDNLLLYNYLQSEIF